MDKHDHFDDCDYVLRYDKQHSNEAKTLAYNLGYCYDNMFEAANKRIHHNYLDVNR